MKKPDAPNYTIVSEWSAFINQLATNGLEGTAMSPVAGFLVPSQPRWAMKGIAGILWAERPSSSQLADAAELTPI
jgi:hypothetical protein